MRNIIPSFTNDEIEQFYGRCGFTEQESQMFWNRRKELSIEECAERMNVSVRTAIRINKRINSKIQKIICTT